MGDKWDGEGSMVSHFVRAGTGVACPAVAASPRAGPLALPGQGAALGGAGLVGRGGAGREGAGLAEELPAESRCLRASLPCCSRKQPLHTPSDRAASQ